MSTLSLHPSSSHNVWRDHLFTDTISLFREEAILHETSLIVSFEGEMALDGGGVRRDMLSAFWEISYRDYFDGCTLLRPVLHPHMDMATLPTLGTAISHGYLHTGFLPTRIAFPSLVSILKGPQIQVPTQFLRTSLVDYVSSVDKALLQDALSCQKSFTPDIQSRLMTFFSRFECRQLPTASNLPVLLDQVARYEFLIRPMAPISMIHQGIPEVHRRFWDGVTVESLYLLYQAMVTNPTRVLEMIEEPELMNGNEERVFRYLLQFVGNLSNEDIQRFLRFVTGSAVAVSKKITVEFNSLSGLAQRPICHTCGQVLELRQTYNSYVEFATQFKTILADDTYCWLMDAV